MPGLPILMIVAFAVFADRAAETENESGLLWCGLAVLISVVTWFFLDRGRLGILPGQVGFRQHRLFPRLAEAVRNFPTGGLSPKVRRVCKLPDLNAGD